ncbi:MAG: hypothetical protein ACTSYL_01860 [Candidatus Thorarchaeota archaeon]
MESSDYCSWLRSDKDHYTCGLRNQIISKGEVAMKCSDFDRSVMCIDAYTSLAKGQEMMSQQSSDAILWLIEAVTQFENLGETDNAILTAISGLNFLVELGLINRAYEIYRYCRTVYESGKANSDPTLQNPSIRETLLNAGRNMITTANKLVVEDNMRSMQAELKATLLSGGGLKKVEHEEQPRDITIVDGRQLYAKKSKEYKEGAETYIKSGLIKNAIVFACMGALADLMLGRPKEGIKYLTQVAEDSGFSDKFNQDPCFKWTKLLFRAYVSRETETIEKARKEYYSIPFAFKDDQEFARRVMDSIYRRISGGK